MIVKLHQFSFSGNVPVYVVAEEVEAVTYYEWSTDFNGSRRVASLLTMKNGNSYQVEESPLEVMGKLQSVLPERWEFPEET